MIYPAMGGVWKTYGQAYTHTHTCLHRVEREANTAAAV